MAAKKKKYLCYINSDRTCSHTKPAVVPLIIEWYPRYSGKVEASIWIGAPCNLLQELE